MIWSPIVKTLLDGKAMQMASMSLYVLMVCQGLAGHIPQIVVCWSSVGLLVLKHVVAIKEPDSLVLCLPSWLFSYLFVYHSSDII